MKTAMKEKPVLFSGPMIRALRSGRKTVTRRIVIPQPPQSEEVIAKAGIDFHLFTDDSSPGKFRVAGPVWAVRNIMQREPIWKCPYGSAGTRLWVRESCWLRPELTRKMIREGADTWPPVIYTADQTEADREWTKEHGWIRRNSIHMPRVACRIVLEVENVGLQRLHEISEEDAQAEGFDPIVADPWWQGYRDVSGMGLIQQQHRGAEPPDWMIEPKLMAIRDPLAKSAISQFRLLWEAINGDRGFGWSTNCYVWRVKFKVVEGLA